MSWDAEIKELERRRYLAKQQGGEAGIAKQHASNRDPCPGLEPRLDSSKNFQCKG